MLQRFRAMFRAEEEKQIWLRMEALQRHADSMRSLWLAGHQTARLAVAKQEKHIATINALQYKLSESRRRECELQRKLTAMQSDLDTLRWERCR